MESPIQCSTSTIKKELSKVPVSQSQIGALSPYPIAMSNKPRIKPLRMRSGASPFFLDFINRYVKTIPEIVKNIGAVIPLK